MARTDQSCPTQRAPLLLDVRTVEEFKADGLYCAHNVPLGGSRASRVRLGLSRWLAEELRVHVMTKGLPEPFRKNPFYGATRTCCVAIATADPPLSQSCASLANAPSTR